MWHPQTCFVGVLNNHLFELHNLSKVSINIISLRLSASSLFLPLRVIFCFSDFIK